MINLKIFINFFYISDKILFDKFKFLEINIFFENYVRILL